MNSSFTPKFVILAILDGWGIAPPSAGNAIRLANTVNMNKFWVSYPHTELRASGEAVGLPRGEDGNTETGHLNLGAGRIVYQDLERINMHIADDSFYENKTLLSAIDHAIKNNSKLHLMGLIGGGGVHSSMEHLLALINLVSRKKFERLYLHLFTDGRDSPPTSAKTYIGQVKNLLAKNKVGKIATIMGRYWAMDRDLRWDRIEKAYNALTKGVGKKVKSAEEAIEVSYGQGTTDEFIEPSVIVDESDKPVSLIDDNDAIIFFNFRIDRPRELTKAFMLEDFSKATVAPEFDPYIVNRKGTHTPVIETKGPFARQNKLKGIYFVTMTEYEKSLSDAGVKAAFPPEVVDNPISAIISSQGSKQLKITESEKERFVTVYFNGLREVPFEGEDKVIIPSPKVPTYDQEPQMSADKLTETLLKKLQLDIYKLIILNFPNADMVGHTGNIGPAVKAIEKVDDCIGKIANYCLAYDGVLVITADHGNAEEMINLNSNEIDTEHSVNPVPFIVIARLFTGVSRTLPSGILADVAPTILSLLGLNIPTSMTGRNLLNSLNGNY